MNRPELGNWLGRLCEAKSGKGLWRADLRGLSGNWTGARVSAERSRGNREIDRAERLAAQKIHLKVWQPFRLYGSRSLASAAHIKDARLHAAIALHRRRDGLVNGQYGGRCRLSPGGSCLRQQQQ